MKRIILTIALFAMGCKAGQLQDSKLSIDDGVLVRSTDKNQISATILIASASSLCSATIVSKNTALTAGHCVQEKVCIRSSPYQNLCPVNTYLHDKYVHDVDNPSSTYDIAVLEFSGTPFKSYFEVSTSRPVENTEVSLVGYAPEKVTFENVDPKKRDPNAKAAKRWGWNQIRSTESNVILTVAGDDFFSVGVSPGDSGGPMFSSCKLIGVASLLGVKRFSAKVGVHAMLSYSEITSFLKGVESKSSAVFCGLSTNPGDKCDQSIAYTEVVNSADETTFPCESPLEGVDQDIYFALEKAPNNPQQAIVHMSTRQTAGIAGYCINTQPQSCKPNSRSFIQLSRSPGSGSRSIYTTDRFIKIQDQNISLVVRSAQDQKLTHAREVSLKVKYDQ